MHEISWRGCWKLTALCRSLLMSVKCILRQTKAIDMLEQYDWPLMVLLNTNERNVGGASCKQFQQWFQKVVFLYNKSKFFIFFFYTERQTKELSVSCSANPLLCLNPSPRCAGEREAVRLRRHCRLRRGRCGEPGSPAHQPQQELSGPPGSDRGALPGLPEWSPELRPGGGGHLHRLQQLLHRHGTIGTVVKSSILTL